MTRKKNEEKKMNKKSKKKKHIDLQSRITKAREQPQQKYKLWCFISVGSKIGLLSPPHPSTKQSTKDFGMGVRRKG